MEPVATLLTSTWPPPPTIVRGAVHALCRFGLQGELVLLRSEDVDTYVRGAGFGTGDPSRLMSGAPLYLMGMRVVQASADPTDDDYLPAGVMEVRAAPPFEKQTARIILRKDQPIGDGTPLEAGRT